MKRASSISFKLFEQLYRAANLPAMNPHEKQKYTLLVIEDELLLQFYEMIGLTHQQMLKSIFLGLFMNNHVIEIFDKEKVTMASSSKYNHDPNERTIDGIRYYPNYGFFGNYSDSMLDERLPMMAFDGVLIPPGYGNEVFDVERLKIQTNSDDFIRSSIIDWTLTDYYVFMDTQNKISFKDIPETYLDEVPEDGVDFGDVFEKMKLFASKKMKPMYSTIVMPSMEGDVPALLTTWQNETERLSHWFCREDFGGDVILYADAENFLLVGNISAHPSVLTKNFTFYNSHGSTNDEFPNPGSDLDKVVSFAVESAQEYVKNHVH